MITEAKCTRGFGFYLMHQLLHHRLIRIFWAAIFMMTVPSHALEIIHQEPSEFIAESFSSEPTQHVLWFTKDIKTGIHEILDHDYPGLRLRYWKQSGRTAWILEEIGKVKPITAGFVVEQNVLLRMQVLIYRESHGGEVRFPFFSNQFEGLELNDHQELSQTIDGISGATLSVNALTKLARMALYLHSEVIK